MTHPDGGDSAKLARELTKHERLWSAIDALESVVDRLESLSAQVRGASQPETQPIKSERLCLTETLSIAPDRLHGLASRTSKLVDELGEALY